MTHEGTNKNQDHFLREELKAAADSPRLKQINWEHGEPAIGTIYKSEYKEIPSSNANFSSADGKRARIECEGVIWKYKYPQYAKTMINRHNKGELSFSMETYFSKAECSQCHQVFDSKDHGEGSYCEHLNYRNTAVASEGEKPYRILRDNTFGGVACVENPADVGAGALALAKEKEREEEQTLSDQKTYSQEDLEKAIADAIETFKSDLENNKELETAQAEVVKLKADLTKAGETLDSITEERDKAIKEFEEFKTSIESEKKLSTRFEELAEAGYDLPDKTSGEFEELAKAVKEYTDEGFKFFVKSIAARRKMTPEERKKLQEEMLLKKKGKKTAKASVRVPSGGINSVDSDDEDDDDNYDDKALSPLKNLVAKL